MTGLFAMPMAVELSQWIGVGGWGCPISSSVSLNIEACLQLRNRAPSSASAAEVTTKRKMAHKVKKCAIQLDGLGGVGTPTHEKMATGSAVGVGLRQVRRVRMDVQDHVGCVKADCCIGMRCQIVQELYGFGHCFLRPLCLFTCNRTEGHEYCEVNCTGVV